MLTAWNTCFRDETMKSLDEWSWVMFDDLSLFWNCRVVGVDVDEVKKKRREWRVEIGVALK